MTDKDLNILSRIAEQIKVNSRGFLSIYYPLVVIFIACMFCDAVSTVYFMLKDGVSNELHPAVLYVSMLLGPVAGPIFAGIAKILAGLAVAIYLKRYAVLILLSASVISLFAAWYNIWGIQIANY